MNWKFWQKATAEQKWGEWVNSPVDAKLFASVIGERDALRTDNEELLARIAKHEQAREDVEHTILTAAPMAEAKVVECFAGGRDHPLFRGVCQVIDTSFDALGHNARAGDNTEKQTNMLLGGQEALVTLKVNLLDYVARAAVQEDMVQEEKG